MATAWLFSLSSRAYLPSIKAHKHEQRWITKNRGICQPEDELDDTERSHSTADSSSETKIQRAIASSDSSDREDSDEDMACLLSESRDVVTRLRPVAITPGSVLPPAIRVVRQWLSESLPQELLRLHKAQREPLRENRDGTEMECEGSSGLVVDFDQEAQSPLSRVGDYLQRLLDWLQCGDVAGVPSVRYLARCSSASAKQKQKMVLIRSGIFDLARTVLALPDLVSAQVAATVAIPMFQILIHLLEVVPTPPAARTLYLSFWSSLFGVDFPLDPILPMVYVSQVYHSIIVFASDQILGIPSEPNTFHCVLLTVMSLRVLNTMVPMVPFLPDNSGGSEESKRVILLKVLLETVAKLMSKFADQEPVQVRAVQLLLDVVVFCGLKARPAPCDSDPVDVDEVMESADSLRKFRELLRGSRITSILERLHKNCPNRQLVERANTVLGFIWDNDGERADEFLTLENYGGISDSEHPVAPTMPGARRMEI
jgi:hypothetical protein